MNALAAAILVTVDVALFSLAPAGGLCLLLPPRAHEPFARLPALPGVAIQDADADAAAAARRALAEKAELPSPYLEQLASFSGPARDPRGWSVSIAHYALIPWAVLGPAAAFMIPVDALPRLPFDHSEIAAAALARLRSKSAYSALPLHLMPATFTLAALQDVYEAVIGEPIGRTLFRKRMVESNLILETGESTKGGAHRPAALYRTGRPGFIPPLFQGAGKQGQAAFSTSALQRCKTHRWNLDTSAPPDPPPARRGGARKV